MSQLTREVRAWAVVQGLAQPGGGRLPHAAWVAWARRDSAPPPQAATAPVRLNLPYIVRRVEERITLLRLECGHYVEAGRYQPRRVRCYECGKEGRHVLNRANTCA